MQIGLRARCTLITHTACRGARLGQVRLPEQELGIELEPRILLVFSEDGRELRNQGMTGVDLEHGADLQAKHPDGRTVLQIARDQGFDEMVDLLSASMK